MSKPNEVKCYALTVPTDEVIELWMGNPQIEEILTNHKGLAGINPDPSGLCQHLLFYDAESRTKAYNRIHIVLPDSLLAYNPVPVYVDKKYLMQN